MIAEQPADVVLLPDLVAEQDDLLATPAVRHSVAAYLSGLVASIYTAETMPWHLLRRPHVLSIRQLLADHYQPATGNRMLAAIPGVVRECTHLGLMSADHYQAAASVPAVRGESEARGRDLSMGELRGLFEACARALGRWATSRTPARGAVATLLC